MGVLSSDQLHAQAVPSGARSRKLSLHHGQLDAARSAASQLGGEAVDLLLERGGVGLHHLIASRLHASRVKWSFTQLSSYVEPRYGM